MSIAVVFSGQGSQYPGMGKSLAEAYPEAAAVFDDAGSELTNLCYEGTPEALKETSVTQPAVYTVSMAAWSAFYARMEACGMSSELRAMAGFSLGELSAHVACGVIHTFSEGLSIVKQRARVMAEAGVWPTGEPRGVMAAALGARASVLDAVTHVKELIAGSEDEGLVLEAVNFNSPKQTVVAGDVELMDMLKSVSKDYGIKLVALSVSTAFHSPIMAPASEAFAIELSKHTFGTPGCILYANASGQVLLDGSGHGADGIMVAELDELVRTNLAMQLKSPVYWQDIIEDMSAKGVDTIVELGPGKTLTGLCKQIAPDIKAFHIEDKDTMEDTLCQIKSLKA